MASLTINENVVCELSTDDCRTWQEIDPLRVEQDIRRSYRDGGLMIANLLDGMTVVTPTGKYRARMLGDPYLRRKSGLDKPFHIIGEDGQTSRCGAANVQGKGYQVVYREKVLESMLCANCLIGRKVR